jgi:hypothetical protein
VWAASGLVTWPPHPPRTAAITAYRVAALSADGQPFTETSFGTPGTIIPNTVGGRRGGEPLHPVQRLLL